MCRAHTLTLRPLCALRRFEDAAELFVKAANSFKMGKMWQEAGESFVAAAECHLKMKSKYEAASSYVDAGSAFKKSNFVDAVGVLALAIDLYCNEGRFQQAAKLEKECAELFEAESDTAQAIEHYQKAADLFSGEDSTSLANQCMLKVAQFSAANEDYDRAIQIFEDVARASLDSPLLKWSVKDYYLKAGLCRLAAESVNLEEARKAIERYQDMDTSFSQTRECKLLMDVLEAYEEVDVDTFTEVVFEFDQVSKLDPWKTSLLLKIKQTINKGGDLT